MNKINIIKVHSSSQYPSNILTKLIVGNSFSGGARSSNPMDNDIAISDKGVIVCDNGQILDRR
ncbi:MAG: hypothetical protein IPH96_00580 [Saprospiraceae bacterium]|nr:hypothetical protein [Saprospiraceae bacterium]